MRYQHDQKVLDRDDERLFFYLFFKKAINIFLYRDQRDWQQQTEGRKEAGRHHRDHRQICRVIQRGEKPQGFFPYIKWKRIPVYRHIVLKITYIVGQHDIGDKASRDNRQHQQPGDGLDIQNQGQLPVIKNIRKEPTFGNIDIYQDSRDQQSLKATGNYFAVWPVGDGDGAVGINYTNKEAQDAKQQHHRIGQVNEKQPQKDAYRKQCKQDRHGRRPGKLERLMIFFRIVIIVYRSGGKVEAKHTEEKHHCFEGVYPITGRMKIGKRHQKRKYACYFGFDLDIAQSLLDDIHWRDCA